MLDACRKLKPEQYAIAGSMNCCRLSPPDGLATPATYSRPGRTANLPPWVVLRHIVNRTTYHRGQVASKLKPFRVQQAETALVYWAFEQTPQKA
jgi:uncharacterized damage-inducible protein DinB